MYTGILQYNELNYTIIKKYTEFGKNHKILFSGNEPLLSYFYFRIVVISRLSWRLNTIGLKHFIVSSCIICAYSFITYYLKLNGRINFTFSTIKCNTVSTWRDLIHAISMKHIINRPLQLRIFYTLLSLKPLHLKLLNTLYCKYKTIVLKT